MIEYRIKNNSDKFDIDKCLESAESGYAPAQYQLGQCYEDGIGVQRNLAKAFRWYWIASGKSRQAQERLNKDSYQGQLAKWLRKAVNRKDLTEIDLAEIICMLGSCYMHSWGIDRDMKLAVEWWRKAAELGNAYADNCLGYCYSIGQGGLAKDAGHGVEQDWKKAVELYREAADMSDPEAQYRRLAELEPTVETDVFEKECEQEEYTSPKETNTIIVQYDFMSRPTVYKKHWLWDKELWSYPGSGFMETVHFGVEWLSEESFRIFYEDLRDDKYNEDFIITIP